MRKRLLFASLLASAAAWAQSSSAPFVMKTPNEYYILAASGNGKWACGVYLDYNSEQYGFRWNLESGEIETLNSSIHSIAYSISDDGTVVGEFADNTFRSNGAATTMAGYWKDSKWHRLEMPTSTVSQSGAAAISPDGQYITGHIEEDGKYIGYVWKNGKIDHVLQDKKGVSMPYTISPDGKLAAGWVQDENRTSCIWDAEGKYTLLNQADQSPWSSARKFSHDGKTLLYFGGWNEDGSLKALYDVATGETTSLMPASTGNFDIFDLSDGASVVMCELDDRGFVYTNGTGTYADDFLTSKGLDLSTMHIYKDESASYYYINRASTVSADGNVMGFQYYNDDKDENGTYSVSLQSMVVKLNQPTTGLCPVAVKASQLSGSTSVLVSWKPNVAAQGIKGYNVYRDGTQINSSLVSDESFVDANAAMGNHNYQVTAVYDGSAESAKSDQAAATVSKVELATPVDLYARQHGYRSAYLDWKAPFTNFGSLTYFNLNDMDLETFGFNGTNISIESAILFNKTKVSAYSGQKIQAVGFYPMEAQGGWKINLYTHDAEGKLQLLYSQPVSQTLNYGQRNVVKLDNPVDVPSGDLLIATEVAVTTASPNILAMDYGRSVNGYSDLVRVKDENDFYSIASVWQTENFLYDVSWAIDATVAPENTDMTKDNVDHYNVYLDGNSVASSTDKDYLYANLADGEHTLGVSAVYADGSESPVATSSVNIKANDTQLAAVDDIIVEPNGETAINATWQTPTDRDRVKLQYSKEEASNQSVTAPAENNYNLMAGVIFPSKTFRGRDGYIIRSARFYPTADAVFTVYLYKDGELISQADVDEVKLNQWNEVKLPEPVAINSKSEYEVVVDCYDVTPKGSPLAVDNNNPVDSYSNLYSLDGSSWNPLTSVPVYGNWLIGMNIESSKGVELPVDGYDVSIDGEKKNSAKITENSFAYDLGVKDNKEHTLQVDVYYTVKPESVKGDTFRFTLGVTGINQNVVGKLQLLQGDNELTVSGNNVTSVEIVSASGAEVASAAGNTVSLNGMTSGVYVVKAVVDGKNVTRKIVIN